MPQSFSAWLDARGERGVLEVAARRSDEAEVSVARCTLTRLYFNCDLLNCETPSQRQTLDYL